MRLITLPTYSSYENRPISKCNVLKYMISLFSDFYLFYKVFVCNFWDLTFNDKKKTVDNSLYIFCKFDASESPIEKC